MLYLSPEYLFLLCPIVLYWLGRNWLLAHRGELKEDPVTLAIRDRGELCGRRSAMSGQQHVRGMIAVRTMVQRNNKLSRIMI